MAVAAARRGRTNKTSYVLCHQPKSFDWRLRSALPHSFKRLGDTRFAEAGARLNQIVQPPRNTRSTAGEDLGVADERILGLTPIATRCGVTVGAPSPGLGVDHHADSTGCLSLPAHPRLLLSRAKAWMVVLFEDRNADCATPPDHSRCTALSSSASLKQRSGPSPPLNVSAPRPPSKTSRTAPPS